MPTSYDELVSEIEVSVALRGILPEESEILLATRERERLLRVELALTPEHVDAQRAWRAFGDWFRAQPRRTMRRRAAPRGAPTPEPTKQRFQFPIVNLPTLDSA